MSSAIYTIIKTTNGGDNWFTVSTPLSFHISSICFINNETGWMAGEGTIISTSPPIGINNIRSEIPKEYSLFQNYPNPFNPATKIRFDIPVGHANLDNVRLVIYYVLGREVTTLVNEQLKPGTYEVEWDGTSFASGIYFYKLIFGDFVKTKKMVLVK